jgi:putative transposase
MEKIPQGRYTKEFRKEVMRDIRTYIELFYNRQRKHERLEYHSPAAYEQEYYKMKKAA